MTREQSALQKAGGVLTDVRLAERIPKETLEAYEAAIAEVRDEVRAVHAWVKEYDITRIYHSRRENEVCLGCKGAPCPKDSMKYLKRKVSYSDNFKQVYFGYCYCKHYLEYQKRNLIGEHFKNSKIPLRYRGKSFADYEEDADNADAVAWAKWLVQEDRFGRGLLFYGEPGCGKTFLAAIVAQELIRQGKTVIFGDVPSILNDLKATFDGGGDKRFDELMSDLENADALVLDDVGTEYSTGWAATQLYTIVNNRYNADKTVIATTNYGAERLKKNFKDNVTGTRIVSRLLQMCEPVEITGSDRRVRRR